MADPERSPIFVIGASRSGTTLMRQMLCAHPRIHLTMEASFYLWGGLYTRFRDPDGFPPYYVRSFSFRWLQLAPAAVLSELPRPFAFADRHRLYTAVMRAQAARFGKPRWGDKTPSHTANLAQIFGDYPDARVIRTLRDPREVIGSTIKMPWASPSLIAGAVLTGLERRQVAKFRDRILEVRLTDLIGQPEETMRRVLAHVDEPWSDQVLDHPTHAPDDLPPMPWFRSAAGERVKSEGPPRNLDPAAMRLLEFLNRRVLTDQGLLPVPLPREPGWLAVAARYLRDLPVALSGLGTALSLARASRSGLDDHDRTQALLHRLNPGAWAALGDFRMPPPPPLPEGWERAWP